MAESTPAADDWLLGIRISFSRMPGQSGMHIRGLQWDAQHAGGTASRMIIPTIPLPLPYWARKSPLEYAQQQHSSP